MSKEWVNSHPVVLLPMLMAIFVYMGWAFLRGLKTGKIASRQAFQDGSFEADRGQNPGWFWVSMTLHGLFCAVTGFGIIKILLSN